MVMGSTEMTCCAECHLPWVMLKREQGVAFLFVRSQDVSFWFFAVNLKLMCKLFVQNITTLR